MGRADADSLYVTDVRNTQLQSKIGPYVDTFLANLLLAELYLRTLELFEKGQFSEEAREARVERVKERVRQAIADREGMRTILETVLATMPASYFLTTPEQSFPHHIELLREFREGEEGGLVSSIRHFRDRDRASGSGMVGPGRLRARRYLAGHEDPGADQPNHGEDQHHAEAGHDEPVASLPRPRRIRSSYDCTSQENPPPKCLRAL